MMFERAPRTDDYAGSPMRPIPSGVGGRCGGSEGFSILARREKMSIEVRSEQSSGGVALVEDPGTPGEPVSSPLAATPGRRRRRPLILALAGGGGLAGAAGGVGGHG